MKTLALALVAALGVSGVHLCVTPRIVFSGGAVRIKVQRSPQADHLSLTVSVVDELGPIRLSEIDLTQEPDRKTWDFLWDGIPGGSYEVVAIIRPSGERDTLSLDVIGLKP